MPGQSRRRSRPLPPAPLQIQEQGCRRERGRSCCSGVASRHRQAHPHCPLQVEGWAGRKRSVVVHLHELLALAACLLQEDRWACRRHGGSLAFFCKRRTVVVQCRAVCRTELPSACQQQRATTAAASANQLEVPVPPPLPDWLLRRRQPGLSSRAVRERWRRWLLRCAVPGSAPMPGGRPEPRAGEGWAEEGAAGGQVCGCAGRLVGRAAEVCLCKH